MKQRESTRSISCTIRGEGFRLVEKGDILSGLVWFAEALSRDSDNPVRERIHRVRLGAYVRSFPKLINVRYENDALNFVEFSKDGKRFVTASGVAYADRGERAAYAQVWYVASGEPIGKPLRHNSAVYSASFSPDGCPGPAKVYSHACTAIDWTMPMSVGIFTAQVLQDAHLTDIRAQRKQSTPICAADAESCRNALATPRVST